MISSPEITQLLLAWGAGDDALRQEVEGLLAADAASSHLLDQPVGVVAAHLLGRSSCPTWTPQTLWRPVTVR
jgi:hypothetical protein